MNYQVLLSLDLENNVTPIQRESFYKSLQQQGWEKIPDITTTWKFGSRHLDEISLAEQAKEKNADFLISVAQNCLKKAAQKSLIQKANYKASIFAGLGKIKTF